MTYRPTPEPLSKFSVRGVVTNISDPYRAKNGLEAVAIIVTEYTYERSGGHFPQRRRPSPYEIVCMEDALDTAKTLDMGDWVTVDGRMHQRARRASKKCATTFVMFLSATEITIDKKVGEV